MHSTIGSTLPSNRVYSPVTLNQEWSTLGRLLFIVLCSSLGTVINGFFFAAFFVEHSLRRIGNVFMACVGLSDLMVTTAVMPTAAVVLLSGEWDTIPVCQVLQFLTEASTYSYSLFFMLVSIENYFKHCRSTPEYEFFINMRIGLVSIMVFVVSFMAAGAGVYLDLDYDYCQRRHYGNSTFRTATSIIFYANPFVLTILGFISASVSIYRRSRKHSYYRRSQQYERDFSMCTLNIIGYFIFVVSWIPYLVIVHELPDTSDSRFYHSAWVGVFRSMITSFLYSTLNKSFRSAFSQLFYYCCCKSTLTGSFHSRHRRVVEFKNTPGEVRVHIMHQAMNISSPQRAASSTRETQEL